MNAALGKASISDETFDEFLAALGLLESCEQAALDEIARDQALQSPLPVRRQAQDEREEGPEVG